MTGVIVKAISGFYYIDADNKIIECRARGVLRKTGTPLVGDIVQITLSGDGGVVEKITDRKNSFVRPPIANIEKLFIVSSFSNPSPNTLLIDKMIVLCEKNNIEPVIVFNKSDMGDFSEYKKIYENAGFKTFVISCENNDGIDKIKNEIMGICAFTGNSGVGKSTILNSLFPQFNLKTADVSQKLGRGRHTTRHTELFKTENGFVADTPGFSNLDVLDIEKEDLIYLFRETKNCIGQCQFTSCSHTKEKGCAVIKKVQSGEIEKSRFESYCKMYEELKSINKYKK